MINEWFQLYDSDTVTMVINAFNKALSKIDSMYACLSVTPEFIRKRLLTKLGKTSWPVKPISCNILGSL